MSDVDPSNLTQISQTPPAARSSTTGARADDNFSAERFYDLMTNRVLHEVLEKVEERQSRRFGKLAGILTVAMTLVAGAVVTYFDAIAEKSTQRRVTDEFTSKMPREITFLEGRVDSQVRGALEQSIAGVKQDIAASTEFLEFMILVDSISRRSSFSNSEAREIMAFLRRHAKNERIKGRTAFPGLLEKVIDAFFAAAMVAEMDEIFVLYRNELLGRKEVLLTLVQHYGLQLMGTVGAPRDWPGETIEKMESILKKLRHGVERAPDMAMAYTIMLTGIRTPTDQSLSEMISELSDLDTDDRAEACRQLRRHTEARNIARNPQTQHRRIAERITAIFAAHKEAFRRIECEA